MGADFHRGALVGSGYRLEREIGRGGWSVVWVATHVKLQQPRAIKILSAPNDDKRARFLREGRAGATIEHPNLVPVLDIFEIGETLALVLPFLDGETLEAKLARDERLSLADTSRILTPVVSAVLCAHENGLVHRDLKPSNIFLEHTHGAIVPRVLDFGVAKLRDHDDEVQKTKTGVSLGTAGYMAPEQLIGVTDIDGRSDIWALGAILYECLAGFRPVEPSSANDQMYNALKTRSAISIVPLGTLEPDLPRDVTELVMAMLAMDREDRPALERVVEVLVGHDGRLLVAPRSTPLTARSRWWLAGVALAGSVLVIAFTALCGRLAPSGSDAERNSPARSSTAPPEAPRINTAPSPLPTTTTAETPATSAGDAAVRSAPPGASSASTATTKVKPKRLQSSTAATASTQGPVYDPLGDL